MDHDFITTCNWTKTGTFTLQAFRGSNTNVVTSYKLFYRKKGDANWTETTNGQVNITSTGEWEIANDWNKSGNDVLTHSYYGITAINSCTNVYFNEAGLGTTIGNYFLFRCWYNCSSLTSMPSGFNLPTGITSVGNYFLSYCWCGCSSLISMPSGFNLPTGITSVGSYFLSYCWYGCSSLISMPSGFNLPTGITSVVGSYFLYCCWYGCSSLTSMPSGFNLPTGITSVGSYFLYCCWCHCKNLKQDAYTEDIVFEFNSTDTFGGTCPITPDSITGASEASPVKVAVNRTPPKTILEEYFNSYALTDLNGQGSWSGDTSFDVSTAGAKEGRRGVENADTSGNNKDIAKTGIKDSDGRIAVYLKRTNTTGQTLLVLNEGANERVAVGLGNDGHIKYKNSSGSFVNLGADTTYSANTWYLLEVEWRSSDHKIRILVDGTLKQDWISPASNWTSYLDKVILRVNQSSGTSYWDYISEFGTSVNTSNWSYKKKYKIDQTKIDEDLTDFQVLVKIDNTKPNYQHFFDNAGTGGASVRFVSSLGSSKALLKFEKVRFDAANKKAEYFVKIPSVSKDNDTYFYLIYGRSGALDGSDKTEVWTDNFKSVWHLEENPAGTAPQMKDSTINGNNGTSGGSMTSDDLVDAKVAKGLDFDGSNDYIATASSSDFAPSTATISFLVKPAASQSTSTRMINIQDASNKNYDISINKTSYKVFFINWNGASASVNIVSTSALSSTEWKLVTITVGNNNNRIYINGVEEAFSSNNITQPASSVFNIGRHLTNGWYFNGLIDEVSISNVVRSAARIKADYNSLFDTLIKEELFILADTGSYALTGITTGLKAFRKLLVGAGSYALTGINVVLGFFRKLFANAGSYSLTGFDVALYLHTVYNLILSAGSYTLTGINTGLKALRRLVSLAGSYTLTGISAGLFRAYTFILSRGSYALTGIDILFRKGYAVMCETGELVLTGVDTLLRALRKLALSRGSYTLTGINTILKALRKLITNTGSYILTGVDTVLKAFRKLVSSVGSYVLTGIGAGLGAFRKMMVDAGSYTLTGIATGLNRLYTFIISAGSYALTGIEAIFYKAYVLIASVGSYILTGTKAKLTAWIKEILHSATWTKEDTHSAEWTKEDTHNTIWHKE